MTALAFTEPCATTAHGRQDDQQVFPPNIMHNLHRLPFRLGPQDPTRLSVPIHRRGSRRSGLCSPSRLRCWLSRPRSAYSRLVVVPRWTTRAAGALCSRWWEDCQILLDSRGRTCRWQRVAESYALVAAALAAAAVERVDWGQRLYGGPRGPGRGSGR